MISITVGFAYMLLVGPILGTTTTILVLSLGLAAPVGFAKTATACGLNVIADLAPTGRPQVARLTGATLYAITLTATAAGLGLALSLAGSWVRGASTLPVAAAFLALLGLTELGSFGNRRVPNLPWQVPAEWVHGRSSGPVVWGALLGTGLTTYMPYATYFGVLLLALLLPPVASVALMTAYGLGRAAPTIAAASQRNDRLLRLFHDETWRLRSSGHVISGCTSLALAGALWATLFR